jgi:ATP-dependent DNA helicase RecG
VRLGPGFLSNKAAQAHFVLLSCHRMPDKAAQTLTLTASQFWERFGTEESSTLDFKEELSRAGKLQEVLVAFANARGGTAIVGVTSTRPHRILGVSWDQESEERVQEAARITHPPLNVSTSRLDVDGTIVALLYVAPVERGWVQTSDGRLLVRAGPTNRTLVGAELARFVQERGTEPAEDHVVREATLDDLKPDALRTYLRARLGRPRFDVSAVARDLGLVTPEGRVRLASILLFGKEPQRGNRRFGIDVLRFEGGVEDRPKLRERTQLSGPLPELVEAADRLIYEEMRKDAVIRGLVREEVPEFPPVAIREALLNAVGHRDYSLRGSAVEVKLFDDALEIESPGTLAGYVTVENLREAQYSRNERIMDVFQVLRLVEEAGTGIDRMVEAMEDALLEPPQFEERPSSFLVRFRGRRVFAAEDRLWISRFSEFDLSGDAKVALVYARRQGAVTNEELRTLRGLDRIRSRDVLKDLVSRGLLETVSRGRGTRYVLGEAARRSRRPANVDEQLQAVVGHARRVGSIANRDVRGLLGIDRVAARMLLEAAVAQRFLEPVGERRARLYLPTARAAGAERPSSSGAGMEPL